MQDAIALTIVAIAAGYLGRVAWQSFASKRSGSCGSCGSCATIQKPLVQIKQINLSHAEAQRSQ
jgi:hypothetical protein